MSDQNPTVNSTSNALHEYLKQLSPAKRQLLELRLRQRTGKRAETDRIPKRTVGSTKPCPLSFAQERLWILEQFDPGNPTYNRTFPLRFSGRLDPGILERSLNEIVRRHEVLRANFPTVEGQPVQMITPSRRLDLEVRDLQDQPEAMRESLAIRCATEEAQRPFDISSDLLTRATLLLLQPDEAVLLLSFHHIVFDGWSTEILLEELAANYEAFRGGFSPALPELPIQYPDYACWQRERFQSQFLEAQLKYWKEKLGGVLAALDLPADFPRPSIQTSHGAIHTHRIPKRLSDALKDLSQEANITLFMTLLAAFDTLLHRYTSQTDLIIGTPIAGRNRVELESLIGCFINTLVIRTDLSGDPPFVELLTRLREDVLSALAHHDTPFEKLVEDLQLRRDLSRSPLFQVMFQLRNIPKRAWKLSDLKIAPFELDPGIAKFDLSLDITEDLNGLSCQFEYNTDLLKPATIARLGQHFEVLLEGMVKDPRINISQMPLLTPAERHQLLVEWNDTAKDFGTHHPVHQLFESHAQKTPDAIAVEWEGQHLTYRELNRRANYWAHHLRNLGVRQEALVGLFMEKSLDLIVALLAIHKAGAAFVPLDPLFPKERVAYIIHESNALLLLTQRSLLLRLPSETARTICVDDILEKSSAHDSKWDENPSSLVGPENLAYVIYTSGSTGTPKGVMIEHRSIANYVLVAGELYAITSRDRMLQFSSITFDASLEEIYGALAHGATLVLRTDAMLASTALFIRKVREQGITLLILPTAFWQDLVLTINPSDQPFLDDLRIVSIGGERLLPERLNLWRERVGRLPRLMNLYGPTETTVAVTSWDATACSNEDTFRRAPIGRPLANLEAHILDSHLQPVPVGVVGELFVGGIGLARGYLNQPELTRDRFLPHPFRSKPGERLYRTGDLARFLPDGNIQFVGRWDNQVKIRGFRIELAEIENTLRRHPAVFDAVVIAREDSPAINTLTAYVKSVDRRNALVEELRSFLREKLPEYMVPVFWVFLETFPLNSSGKIDRQALPVPEHTHPETGGIFIRPRTSVEEVVAGIWSAVLHLEKVSVRDNFFSLGGHSLLAIRVLSRLREAFDQDVPLRRFFEAPTVESLAQSITIESKTPTAVEKRAKLLLNLAELTEDEASKILQEKVSLFRGEEGR